MSNLKVHFFLGREWILWTTSPFKEENYWYICLCHPTIFAGFSPHSSAALNVVRRPSHGESGCDCWSGLQAWSGQRDSMVIRCLFGWLVVCLLVCLFLLFLRRHVAAICLMRMEVRGMMVVGKHHVAPGCYILLTHEFFDCPSLWKHVLFGYSKNVATFLFCKIRR